MAARPLTPLRTTVTTALLAGTAVVTVTSFTGCDHSGASPTPVITAASTTAPATATVTINAHPCHLELALDEDTRFQGLSDRHHIADDGGMLFVFSTPETLDFVMRKCYVPIDIIFLDPGGRVVATHRMKVEPYDTAEQELPRYSSEYPAQFAIELAGGSLDKLNVKNGQVIDLPLADLKRRAK